jgi:hypothetical protein
MRLSFFISRSVQRCFLSLKTLFGYANQGAENLINIGSVLQAVEGGAPATPSSIGANTGPGGTGKRVRISGYELWQFDNDGLIRKSKGHFDSAEYERQLKL